MSRGIKNKISDEEFNKLTNKKKNRIINNRVSAKKSFINKKLKEQKLIRENKIIKETIDLIKIYFSHYYLLDQMNELCMLNNITQLPTLNENDINYL